MAYFSDLIEIVKKLLPSNAMWIVSTATLGIASEISRLPGYLKEVWPDIRIPEILLFQVALISITLFFGSFILILLFRRYTQSLREGMADIEENLTLINKYLKINEISWEMVKSDVNKNESFNLGLEKGRKFHEHP